MESFMERSIIFLENSMIFYVYQVYILNEILSTHTVKIHQDWENWFVKVSRQNKLSTGWSKVDSSRYGNITCVFCFQSLALETLQIIFYCFHSFL